MGRGSAQRIDTGAVRQTALLVLDDLAREGKSSVTMHYLLDRIQEDMNLSHAGRFNRVGGRSKDLRNRIVRQVAQLIDDHNQWTRGRRPVWVDCVSILPNGQEHHYRQRRLVGLVWRSA